MTHGIMDNTNAITNNSYDFKPTSLFGDFDLSKVKAESVDDIVAMSDPVTSQLMDMKPDVKTPAKRGRKPKLHAYGKSGEKLEKRREQNRRAAAVYRKKMNSKKRNIEEEHARLETENKKLADENATLRQEKQRLEEVLRAHQFHCRFVSNTQETNNNTVLSSNPLPPMASYAPSLGFPTDQFMQEMNAMTPSGQVMPFPPTDQSLVESPYLLNTNREMFNFDVVGERKDGLSPLQCNALSPASHPSCTPDPPNYYQCSMNNNPTVPYATVNTAPQVGISAHDYFTEAQAALEPISINDIAEFVANNMST